MEDTYTYNPTSSKLVNLPVEQIFHHPDNPRKELGDLTELADSIKANGILQNLTVVPYFDEAAGAMVANAYRVIIGHRRLAAAKQAGLKTVPCVVAWDMTVPEQLSTMLMENMHRSDLTLYEQAKGFQMMLDLGDTVEDIARKSGFSQSTVRRRVKLLDLDQEKFQASVARGANLIDYMELDKISDPELRNKVLDFIGTNNFKSKLHEAIETEKTRKYLAEKEIDVAKFAERVEVADRTCMVYVHNYTKWNKKDVVRPSDADTVKYYYVVSTYQIDLYREKTDHVENEVEEKKELWNAELNRQRDILTEASDRAYNRRYEFASGFVVKKEHSPIITETTCKVLIDGRRVDKNLLKSLLGEPFEKFDRAKYYRVCNTKLDDYVPFAILYSCLEIPKCYYWTTMWSGDTGLYHLSEAMPRHLDTVYEFLTALGYTMTDEEKSLQDGTMLQKAIEEMNALE